MTELMRLVDTEQFARCLKLGRPRADLYPVDREQQLLAIVQAQTEIAAARPEPEAVMRIVVALALEVIGAQAAAVEPAGGGQVHVLGTTTPHRLDAPLVHDGNPVGTLSVYADQPQAFTTADSETLTLLASAVAAHLARASAQAPAREHAWDDPLTGLGNRHAYERRIAHECARRGRDGGLLTLALVDLDGARGDGVRRTVAAVLQRWTRSIDGVYRIGEDRFALILPGADAQSGRALAERIAERLVDAHPLAASARFGVAQAGDGNPELLHAAAEAELLRPRADAA
ncbi:MAG TPA: sensor domain-containing diguanylate cyclase [Gaiellales bacterium]|jgi:GGDEF domain-containing protein|nr:sensor domain-containing diguanylate cyclase [Gaiellales bacterium]